MNGQCELVGGVILVGNEKLLYQFYTGKMNIFFDELEQLVFAENKLVLIFLYLASQFYVLLGLLTV